MTKLDEENLSTFENEKFETDSNKSSLKFLAKPALALEQKLPAKIPHVNEPNAKIK